MTKLIVQMFGSHNTQYVVSEHTTERKAKIALNKAKKLPGYLKAAIKDSDDELLFLDGDWS